MRMLTVISAFIVAVYLIDRQQKEYEKELDKRVIGIMKHINKELYIDHCNKLTKHIDEQWIAYNKLANEEVARLLNEHGFKCKLVGETIINTTEEPTVPVNTEGE